MTTRREERKKQEKQEKQQSKKIKEQQKQMNEYKKRMKPLYDFLIKKELKINTAAVGNYQINYFRIDELNALVQKEKQQINQSEQLTQSLKKMSKDFIYFKRPEHVTGKYPNKLQFVDYSSQQKKYLAFKYPMAISSKLKSILIVLGVLFIVLFPIWPYELKYGMLILSEILLVFLSAILIVRLVVYLLFVLINYEVWILPDFLEIPAIRDRGILGSVLPLVFAKKGDKSCLTICIRLFAFSLFLMIGFHMYMNPTFVEGKIMIPRYDSIFKIVSRGHA